MNVMSAFSKVSANLRSVADEAASLAQVRTSQWTSAHTERLLRLDSAAGEAAAGVVALRDVNFTGRHAATVRSTLDAIVSESHVVARSSRGLGRTVAGGGREAIGAHQLGYVADGARPIADGLQAVRNLVYRP